MTIKVKSHSRYKLSDVIITPEGNDTFGLMRKFSFLNPDNLTNDQIISFTVDGAVRHRPDLISNLVYGTPTLHWVVYMFNRPRNPFRWPEVNEVIKLPTRDVVLPIL